MVSLEKVLEDLNSNLEDRFSETLFGAGSKHKFLGQIISISFRELVTLLGKSFKAHGRDCNRTSDCEFPRIDLCLCLLDLEHRSGNFGSVLDFHELHTADFDSRSFNALVHEVTHGDSDQGSITAQRRHSIILGAHRE